MNGFFSFSWVSPLRGRANAMLLAAAIAVTLGGCFKHKDSANEIAEDYQVIVIDSCEYIAAKAPFGDYGWVMSHKGNCKFCAERNKNR